MSHLKNSETNILTLIDSSTPSSNTYEESSKQDGLQENILNRVKDLTVKNDLTEHGELLTRGTLLANESSYLYSNFFTEEEKKSDSARRHAPNFITCSSYDHDSYLHLLRCIELWHG